MLHVVAPLSLLMGATISSQCVSLSYLISDLDGPIVSSQMCRAGPSSVPRDSRGRDSPIFDYASQNENKCQGTSKTRRPDSSTEGAKLLSPGREPWVGW